MSLFDHMNDSGGRDLTPLADRMRPETLDDFFGQEHIVGKGRLLRRAIEADRMTSCIFYGPPGCGKTTLASIIAHTTSAAFVRLNAVTTGVGEVREEIRKARDRRKMYARATYLLLDECHRWSNPMVSMTPAIVSRCRVFAFRPLTEKEVLDILRRALADREKGLAAMNVDADEDALCHIAAMAGGDVRSALNALELAALTTPTVNGRIRVDLFAAEESIQRPQLRCGETEYYDMLSAFCKSMRGGDSDAALLWFSRLLYAGADPRLIVRRIIVHASEDVGLANPAAMLQAAAAATALETVGMPEARVALAQAVIAVAESPKSNSVSAAMEAARKDAEAGRWGEVPPHLRDSHYAGNERLGVTTGRDYLYPHDFPGHFVPQQYMPDDMVGTVYYRPARGRLAAGTALTGKKMQYIIRKDKHKVLRPRKGPNEKGEKRKCGYF